MPAIPMEGKQFGRWSVIRRDPRRNQDGVIYYVCRCECGTERAVIGSMLRNGLSKSCGCDQTARLKAVTRHGLYQHRLYFIWSSMMGRCYNDKLDNYARYGGRGISVCRRWHSLEHFIEDNDLIALPGLSIDRINNDGNYKPSNVRWTTAVNQMNNRSTNVMLTFNERTQTSSEWARELGFSRHVLYDRLRSGMSVEEALTKPKAYRRPFKNLVKRP